MDNLTALEKELNALIGKEFTREDAIRIGKIASAIQDDKFALIEMLGEQRSLSEVMAVCG